MPGKPDWIVLHSLVIRRHVDKLMGEADFVVIVPGRGVVVVEAKAPSSIDYADGVWYLDGVPDPGKSPLEQVGGAVRSIRSFLLRQGVIEGNEPFAGLPDVGEEAQAWADAHDLAWDDLLDVALSRAKYRAVVIETRS